MENNTDDKTTVALTPGFYKIGVSPNSDTVTIQKLNVKVATPKIKPGIEDVKYPQSLEEDQIDLMAR